MSKEAQGQIGAMPTSQIRNSKRRLLSSVSKNNSLILKILAMISARSTKLLHFQFAFFRQAAESKLGFLNQVFASKSNGYAPIDFDEVLQVVDIPFRA
ncbi:MAG: hypothetical protein K2X00_09665 [Nitrospiraceae bacterium]|nr:hypothetical protein [Nitrospiraceae bacterium]